MIKTAHRLALMMFVCGLAAIPATVAAQQKTPPSEKALTPAQLRARVKALELELAGVRRDYELLLGTVTARSSGTPSVPTAEERDRAALAAKEQAIYEANQRAYDEQLRQLEDASWYVKGVDFGVTEQNRVFARFGWKATIHNGTPRAHTYDVEVQFLDDRGLIIDTDRLYRHVIAGQDEQVLRGEALVGFPAAVNVKKVNVIAKRHPERR
jgi:hypothetical protein